MSVDHPDTFHILKTYEAGQRSHLKTYVNCLRCEQYQTGQRSHLKTYVTKTNVFCFFSLRGGKAKKLTSNVFEKDFCRNGA